MFWGSSTKRSDPSSQSDSGASDQEDDRRRSKRSDRRSKKGRRHADSKNYSSWFGGLVGSTNPPTKKKSSKKHKKSKVRDACFANQSGRSWAKIALGTLLGIYLLNFFNILYFDRPKDFSVVPSKTFITEHSNRSPVNASDVGRDTDGTSGRPQGHMEHAAVHRKAVQNGHSHDAQNPSRSHATSPGIQHNAATSHETRTEHAGSDQAPKEVEKHPMNHNMVELQVPGGTGPLPEEKVKEYYRKLAKAYLSTFTGGIHRQMYFDILRRRTYSMTPPGANKGIQTILFQIINRRIFMMDPYEVPRNSKPFYRTRINQVIWLLSKLCHEGRVKNTEFLMAIHDCVQTVNKEHSYRGAHFKESNPAFTIVSCNFSDNVPFPMWEGAKHRDGGFSGWDATMKRYAEDDVPWEQKQNRAVFRGGNRPSMFFKNRSDADHHCTEVGRTRLLYLAQQQPDEFDVSVGGTCGGKHTRLSRLDAKAHHNFKYILYAEGNCMWADRSKQHLFGPSVMVKQETPCGQFFEPLLTPETHYIPTDFFFTNTVEKINWARANDETARRIVKNANEFAHNFLTLKGVETYVEVLLEEYTALLVEPDVKLENGAIDVTDKEV